MLSGTRKQLQTFGHVSLNISYQNDVSIPIQWKVRKWSQLAPITSGKIRNVEIEV